MADEGFYWCKKHERVEEWPDVCRALDRLGPYETAEDARNWKAKAEARNQEWDEDDEEWESWPDDKPDDSPAT